MNQGHPETQQLYYFSNSANVTGAQLQPRGKCPPPASLATHLKCIVLPSAVICWYFSTQAASSPVLKMRTCLTCLMPISLELQGKLRWRLPSIELVYKPHSHLFTIYFLQTLVNQVVNQLSYLGGPHVPMSQGRCDMWETRIHGNIVWEKETWGKLWGTGIPWKRSKSGSICLNNRSFCSLDVVNITMYII